MDDLELHDHVTLADGSEFPCDYVATIPNGFMFIAAQTNDLAAILGAFTDKAKTETITYGDHVLTGYTVFVSVMQEAPGQYKIALRRRFVGEE